MLVAIGLQQTDKFGAEIEARLEVIGRVSIPNPCCHRLIGREGSNDGIVVTTTIPVVIVVVIIVAVIGVAVGLLEQSHALSQR
jgi:hypothetical protein